MKIRYAIAILATLAVLPLSIGAGQDPKKVDPTIYKQQLENDRVRVFMVTFRPGQSIKVHKHPDHVVHAVSGGRLMIHETGKDPVTMDVKAGMTLFLPAQSHSAKNMGKTTIKLLVVELK